MLAFCNSFTETLWVAYMFWSPDDCAGDGGNWQTIGWFPMDPGTCTVVYSDSLGDVNNRYWYYYAENAGSTWYWNGPAQVYVTDEAFNHCAGIGISPARIVGFREIDVGDSDDCTVTLTA